MTDLMRVPNIPVDVGEGLRLRANKPCHGVVAIVQSDKNLLHKVGHGVRGKACPFHGLGFFGVEDVAQQYPVHTPWMSIGVPVLRVSDVGKDGPCDNKFTLPARCSDVVRIDSHDFCRVAENGSSD